MSLPSARTIQLTPPVYFVSDAHLGAEPEPIASQQLARLKLLLQRVRDEHGALVINGDLFDFWYEWRTVIPKHYFEILRALKETTEAGIPVHLLPGNHDFRLSGFLEKEIGMVTHHDALIVQIADQNIFVFHGDGLLQRDHGYRILKRILRNPIAQRLFLWLHPDLGMWLARGTSRQSRNATKGNPAEDEEYVRFAKKVVESGSDGVVLGHAHRPMQMQFDKATYVNLGDWIYHYSFAKHDGLKLELLHWNAQDDGVGA
ncbi:MAG: UDP-2,3-diacylglucosamine diphosphatase [Calditrichaeota bacterium]|nr:UDP-2,3-diacylglucosamine diphosphatase [Calditrichota bacterium]MCB9366025.1 UDP-2,3-diacylglucosamine diphosphatase [Calditrichota bacterium]MCB9391849.1 UDP-2,3-diacylglucosamine diphosphatase [Calditrichota bacterium]